MPDLTTLLSGVRYVVVGGTATSLYMAQRITKDVDVLVSAVDASGGTVPGRGWRHF